jgi:hypothetical protein
VDQDFFPPVQIHERAHNSSTSNNWVLLDSQKNISKASMPLNNREAESINTTTTSDTRIPKETIMGEDGCSSSHFLSCIPIQFSLLITLKS